ncbi:uncharacterized protein LOC133482449 isoform X3 [Phyllopteryx taeniolatus]|uniref:uncharacterized protein LOC133482449 isoform X3 n=1 Tax=Phyllopteryx taeniolatus TaxID=161469 RepID=UPI002AD35F70|nr:uncharacterized protein LOC133482449 isoform X3 [Phyllopteryx taeniolatus]
MDIEMETVKTNGNDTVAHLGTTGTGDNHADRCHSTTERSVLLGAQKNGQNGETMRSGRLATEVFSTSQVSFCEGGCGVQGEEGAERGGVRQSAPVDAARFARRPHRSRRPPLSGRVLSRSRGPGREVRPVFVPSRSPLQRQLPSARPRVRRGPPQHFLRSEPSPRQRPGGQARASACPNPMTSSPPLLPSCQACTDLPLRSDATSPKRKFTLSGTTR